MSLLQLSQAGLPTTHASGNSDATAVMLHCSASSGDQWNPLVAQLTDRFETLTPDLYGYGDNNAWPGHKALTLADEIAAVRQCLGHRCYPVHLIGHSYGGAVALKLALSEPDLFSSLTLIEPVAFHLLSHDDPIDRPLARQVQAVSATVRNALINGNYEHGMACFVDYWNGPDSWRNLSDRAKASLIRRINKVVLDFQACFSELTPPITYQALTVPTLLVRGQYAPAPIRRVIEHLEQILPIARSMTIRGVGHMAPLTHPDAVNPAVVEHLYHHTVLQVQAA